MDKETGCGSGVDLFDEWPQNQEDLPYNQLQSGSDKAHDSDASNDGDTGGSDRGISPEIPLRSVHNAGKAPLMDTPNSRSSGPHKHSTTGRSYMGPGTVIPLRSVQNTGKAPHMDSRSSGPHKRSTTGRSYMGSRTVHRGDTVPVRNGTDSDTDENERRRSRKIARKRLPTTSTSEDLQEIKDLLRQLSQKVDRNERCLKELQQNYESSSTASETPPRESRKKRQIPQQVRREVRQVYADLEEEDDENFAGWVIAPGKTIKSPENQAVIQRLIQEVKGLNPTFVAADIRDAAYRFYKSRCETMSAQRRGRHLANKTTKRQHERIVRKRIQRETAVLKNTRLTDEQRSKWMKVMRNDFMSSEESDSDTEDTIVVHPLPWRSHYVTLMFERIDKFQAAKQSPQSRRQTKPRKEGPLSTRAFPRSGDIPDWAVTAENGQ